jgi:nucleotide-binding universal stress UspA family protein
MSDPFRVLVPLDGSKLCERVFPYVRLFHAVMPDLRVELLRCYEPPSMIYMIPELAVPATAMFTEGDLSSAITDYLQARAGELGLPEVETHVAMAEAGSEILERSETSNMVVMASHGRGGLGRWLMGSVTTKVTRGATVPVLVVSAKCIASDAEHPPKMARILVAFDGSPAAERAAYKGASLARGFGASLHLYHGVVQVAMHNSAVAEANRQELQRATEEMRAVAAKLEGLEVQVEVREVHASTGIVEYADEIASDLVIIGSHGKKGLARWMIGSVTEQVLHEAHCPVLVTH